MGGALRYARRNESKFEEGLFGTFRWTRGEILWVFGELRVRKCRSRADLQDSGPDFLQYPAPDRNILKNPARPEFSRFTNKKLAYDKI